MAARMVESSAEPMAGQWAARKAVYLVARSAEPKAQRLVEMRAVLTAVLTAAKLVGSLAMRWAAWKVAWKVGRMAGPTVVLWVGP